MAVLITGATGFVGLHLCRLLESRGETVYGTSIAKGRLRPIGATKLIHCDICDPKSLRSVMRKVRPDQIYHLAAFSSVVNSFEHIHSVFDTNFWGTFNALEAARTETPEARILVVGSGQCYGSRKNGPAKESQPLAPQSPYALTKAAADMLAEQYHERFGLHVIRARPFNHTGPGQSPEFVCSDWALQVASADLGLSSHAIRVGNLSVERDFSDVRDVVRAYESLLRRGRPGEAYNVGSGRSISLQKILKVLTGFSSRPVLVSVQSDRLRPGEARTLYGSNRKLAQATGWKPRIPIEKTLRDLYLYWKERLASGKEPSIQMALQGK